MTEMTLTEFMATAPGGTLEDIAKKYNTSLLNVIDAMPKRCITSGDQFDKIWDTISNWESATLIVHNNDIVLEFKGKIPSGFHRHGYFNLRSSQGLSGHIKAENCCYIALIERKFMEMDTASIIFLNQNHQTIFKIFVGRDEHRQLIASQLTEFHQLASSLPEATICNHG